MLSAIVFWFIFAVVVGICGSSRGRSGIGWFFLAALLSPVLMLILLLVLPRKGGAA